MRSEFDFDSPPDLLWRVVIGRTLSHYRIQAEISRAVWESCIEPSIPSSIAKSP
jgi:hypothetical protein